MSSVPSLREGWAPLQAPLPLLAQTQIRSQPGARLGPEIHGKRRAEGWPSVQMPSARHPARLHIPVSAEPGLGAGVAIRSRPLSCLYLRYVKPYLPPTEDLPKERKSTCLCLSCRLCMCRRVPAPGHGLDLNHPSYNFYLFYFYFYVGHRQWISLSLRTT